MIGRDAQHYFPPPPHVRTEAQMSMLGAPVGPGTDPGLFDAKKSVVRSGEIRTKTEVETRIEHADLGPPTPKSLTQ